MQRNSEPQTSRKLAAVLAADVVGFSRMIAADEAAPVCALHSLLAEVFRPIFANNNGDIVKSMGDGWLVEFASSVAAVNAAMQIQDRLKEDPTISLHVGVHIGDVTRNEHDLYEDGINVAAGLEAITPEGGVMISDAVYSGLGGTLSPSFEAAGAQNLKNIARPVTTWVRARNGLIGHADASEHEITSNLPVLNIRPTANSDPRAELQDTADALTANLATYFGSISWLQTSISSSESAMGYSLRPTLRARGDRLRLETRLQDPGGDIIWTHKSDSRLDDVFDWQDNVVADIADHGLGMIFEAETTKLMATPDEKLTAEQCMLMGIMTWRDFSGEPFVRSAEFHDRAITAKPDLEDA